MRALILLLIPALLLLPVSSAGTAGVLLTYSEGSESCSYDYSHDSWSYTYENGHHEGARYDSQERCDSDHEYASASVHGEDGDVARVYARSNEYGGEDQSYQYGSSSWSHNNNWSSMTGSSTNWGSGYAEREGWSRSAGVESDAANVEAKRGCEQSHTGHYNGSQSTYATTWEDFHYESQSRTWGHTYSSSSECSEGISTDGAGARRVDGCSYDYDHQSYSSGSDYQDRHYSYGQAFDKDTQTCRAGVEATLGDEQVFAGQSYRCQRESSWDYDASSNTTYESSHYDESCFSGVVVEGPGDSVVRAGQKQRDSSSCYYENSEPVYCYGWQSRQTGAGSEGRHNPLGPQGPGIWIPLP